jgi:signal transduction histidine kinase
VALGASLFIYIRSYLQVHAALQEVVIKYHLSARQIFNFDTWVIILTLSILVAIILAGLFIIYIYYQKMIQLYHLQQNFINGFTHELKTPIASLQLFLETFSRYELTREDQLKYLGFMQGDVKRISDNVRRILQLGRLEDKNFIADFETKDLVEIIRNFIGNTPHLFEDGNIVFETSLESLPMKMDVELMEMLLMNLISNAFIYNNAEAKEIVITLKATDKKVYLNISDNGKGMEKDQFKKIFKKFYQVGKTTKGSGLGLFIVQNIARIHHGEVSVFSEGETKGSNFQLIFKLGKT